MIVRLANRDDVELIQSAARLERNVTLNADAALRLAEDERIRIVIAVEGEHLVGYLVAYLLDRLDGRSIALIYDLFVDEPAVAMASGHSYSRHCLKMFALLVCARHGCSLQPTICRRRDFTSHREAWPTRNGSTGSPGRRSGTRYLRHGKRPFRLCRRRVVHDMSFLIAVPDCRSAEPPVVERPPRELGEADVRTQTRF